MAESLVRQYGNLYRRLKKTNDYLNASKEERDEIDKMFKDRVRAASEIDAAGFEQEARVYQEADIESQKEIAERLDKEGSFPEKAAGFFTRGVIQTFTSPVEGVALAAQTLGGESGKEWAENIIRRKEEAIDDKLDAAYAAPAMDLENRFAETVAGNVIEMAPAMLMTGGAANYLRATRYGAMAARAAKSGSLVPKVLGNLFGAEALSGMGIMSIPELYKSAREYDEYGRPILPEKPAVVLAASIPHAFVESAIGMTPGKIGRLINGEYLSRPMLKTLARIKNIAGHKAAAAYLVKSMFKLGIDTVGEGGEEVLQSILSRATRHLANEDFDTAVAKFAMEMQDPEIWDEMYQEFVIGAGAGGLFAGGGTIWSELNSRLGKFKDEPIAPDFGEETTTTQQPPPGSTEQQKKAGQQARPKTGEYRRQTAQERKQAAQQQQRQQAQPGYAEESARKKREWDQQQRQREQQQQAGANFKWVKDAQRLAKSMNAANASQHASIISKMQAALKQAEQAQDVTQAAHIRTAIANAVVFSRLVPVNNLAKNVTEQNFDKTLTELKKLQSQMGSEPDAELRQKLSEAVGRVISGVMKWKQNRTTAGQQKTASPQQPGQQAQQARPAPQQPMPGMGLIEQLSAQQPIPQQEAPVQPIAPAAIQPEPEFAPRVQETAPQQPTTNFVPQGIVGRLMEEAPKKQPAKEAPVKAKPVEPKEYTVSPSQGGFKVVSPDGKQHSWHMSKASAETKAAELNKPKATEPKQKVSDPKQPEAKEQKPAKNGEAPAPKIKTAPPITAHTMTWPQYFNAEIDRSGYRSEYEKNPSAMASLKEHKLRAWITALKAQARVSPIADEVLDSYVDLLGESALRSVFRGEYERGIENWMPKDVREGREKAKKAAKTKPPEAAKARPAEKIRAGLAAEAHAPSGKKLNVQFAAISESDLITSDNTEFPKELQPRKRSKADSVNQINSIAASPIVGKLVTDFPGADVGTPIVVPWTTAGGDKKYLVISGNGRTMAIRKGYADGTMGEYKSAITTADKRFALPSVPDDNPVLVRILTDALDSKQLARLASDLNEEDKLIFSAAEKAVPDSRAVIAHVKKIQSGDLISAANRDFISAFFGEVTSKNDQGRFFDKYGTLNQEGEARLKRAVFTAAYGDSRLAEIFAEDADPNIKNILNIYINMGAQNALIQSMAENNELHNLGLGSAMTEAAELLADLRKTNRTVDNYFMQKTFWDDGVSALAKDILRQLDKYKSSMKKLTELFTDYNESVFKLGDPRQAVLPGQAAPIIPTRGELFLAVVERMTDRYEKKTGDLFSIPPQDSGKPKETPVAERVSETYRTSYKIPKIGENHLALLPSESPDDIAEFFGARSVEIAKGISKEATRNILYRLGDTAAAAGIPIKAIGLNGRLSIIINKTAPKGSGGSFSSGLNNDPRINLYLKSDFEAISHEWFHALDASLVDFATKLVRARKNVYSKSEMASELDLPVRPELRAKLEEIVGEIKKSPMYKRLSKKSAKKSASSAYYKTNRELLARAFSFMYYEQLRARGEKLAPNVFEGVGSIGQFKLYLFDIAPGYKNAPESVIESNFQYLNESYEYYKPGEFDSIRKAFADFFKELRHEVSATGAVKLYTVQSAMADAAKVFGKPTVRLGWRLFKAGKDSFSSWAKKILSQIGKITVKALRHLYDFFGRVSKFLGRAGAAKIVSRKEAAQKAAKKKAEIPVVKMKVTPEEQYLYSEIFPGARLVAKYGQKLLSAAWRLFKRGAAKFADWARGMLAKFGKSVSKQLREMYADLQAFNKRLGREGMIKMGSLGRPGFQTMRSVTAGDIAARRAEYMEPGAVYDDSDGGIFPQRLPSTILAETEIDRNYPTLSQLNRNDNARFKAQQKAAIAEARAKDPAWREFLGMNEKTYKDNETAQLVAEWQAENGNAIFSVEYLIAKYGYKYAKAGYKLLRDGVKAFATWAREMSKQFGKAIHKHLKAMYADLQERMRIYNPLANKRGMIRMGAFGKPGMQPMRSVSSTDATINRAPYLADRYGVAVYTGGDIRNPDQYLSFTPLGIDAGVERRQNQRFRDQQKKAYAELYAKQVVEQEDPEHRRAMQRLIAEHMKSVEAKEAKEEGAPPLRLSARQRRFQTSSRGAAFNVASYAMEKFLDGLTSAGAWAKAMVKKFGNAVKPLLKNLWASMQLFNRRFGKRGAITIPAKYRQMTETFVANVQDRLRPLATTIDKIAPSGLPEHIDPLLAARLYPGRIEARIEDFLENKWKPIISLIQASGESYDSVNTYLYARHAVERNRYARKINPKFAAPDSAGSGMSDKRSARIMKMLRKSGRLAKLQQIGDKIDALSKEFRALRVSYGLNDRQQIGRWERLFKHWVPLKGIDEKVLQEYKGEGFSLSGKDKRMAGRKSRAKDILAYLQQDFEFTLVHGEKNLVAEAFVGMVYQYPQRSLYKIYWAKPKPMFDKNGQVIYRPSFLDRFKFEVFHAKIAGRDAAVEIKDPELLNAMKKWDVESSSAFIRFFSAINRLRSSLVTVYDPEFWVRNWARDIQSAIGMSSVEKSTEIAWNIVKYIPYAAKSAAEYKAGMNTPGAAEFKEYLFAGGKTGHFMMNRFESRVEELQRSIDKADPNILWQSKEFVGKGLDLISDANEVVELSTRFAAYKALRESGASQKKSAMFALDITVNFSTKGFWRQGLNALWMFSGAKIQGTERAIRFFSNAAKTPRGRKFMLAGIALGFFLDLLNAALSPVDPDDGEDEYDKIPEHTKRSSWIIPTGGLGGIPFITVPLPHAISLLPEIGRNIAAMTRGAQTPWESVNGVAAAFVNLLPMGADERGLTYSLMPSTLLPVIDLITETKWTGARYKPIQNPFGVPTLESQRYLRSTPQYLIDFSAFLSRMTGGGKYMPGLEISPADMQKIIEDLGGGVLRTGMRTADTLNMIATGKSVKIRNVPVARIFIGSTEASDNAAVGDFYDNLQLLKRIDLERKEGDKAVAREFKHLYRFINKAEDAAKKLKLLKGSKKSDDYKRAASLKIMKRLNRDIEAARKKSGR